jgi:G-protein signaling modulator 2
LSDREVEAQACYSLGNTYTLLRDFPAAIEYHLWHLGIAQQLKDRVGEGRACWSLGNAYAAMGNHEKALHYANLHLHISKELEDQMGQATAQMNVDDLQKILGVKKSLQQESNKENLNMQKSINATSNVLTTTPSRYRLRRQSMDNLDLIKVCSSNVTLL